MARIRLNVISVDNQQVLDDRGVSTSLSFLRVTSILYLGNNLQATDGLIDTGSALSIFPAKIWKTLRDEIEWLQPVSGQVLKNWWTRVSGVTGGSYASRLGRILVTAADLGGARLPPVPVIGKFAEDRGKLPRIILGMHGGILEGRRMVLEPDLRQAWLEER